MKKIMFLMLIPFLGISQIQIGADIDGEAAADGSGSYVTFSSDGTVLAISADGNDGNGVNSGHVRVYQNISGNWTQLGQDIDGESANDWSGTSASLSSDGTILAIGTRYNSGNMYQSGNVRVYKNIANTWTQIGMGIYGDVALDYSGTSVSISNDGTILAVGAPGNNNNRGYVRVYKNIANVWTQIGTSINGENAYDNSGSSVSISGDGTILAIGAYTNDGINGSNSGHVRVYQNISGNWTQLGQDIDGESANDYSGGRVSLSNNGTTLAIGARSNDGNGTESGHVRVYQYTTNVWTQIGQDIDGEAANVYNGSSVSISGDGTILAVGARSNDQDTDPGKVRIYKKNTNIWTQIGTTIIGEAIGDLSGWEVSLSSNGNTLAIGANFNDGINGLNSGHVRVFDLSSVLTSDSFVQANFKVYPNPVSEILTIELQNNLELQSVNFYNTLGQLVKTYKTTTTNVSELVKGNYFVEVITNQGKATKTIIIE
jgi:hypothetical protein